MGGIEMKQEEGIDTPMSPMSPTSPHSSFHDENHAQHKDGSTDPERALDLALTKSRPLAETLSLPREIAMVTIVCMAQFMTQAATGNTVATLHIIGDSFGITNDLELSWIIAGYSLTVGSFVLISGRFGDVFGYKKMLLIGFAWFALWSLVAGLAVYSNYVLFVFARVLQGIGPAIVLPNGLAILGASYAPGRRKAFAFAIFGACAPNGSVAGSAMGAVFALAWWPWMFWSLAIVLAIIVVIGYFVIPEPPKKIVIEDGTLWDKIVLLDLPGAFTGITALVLFNFAWNQAPIVGWQQPYVYVVLIISLLLVPLFFYIEVKLAPDPLIPFEALSSDVCFVLVCVACGWACFGVWFFYSWQFFEVLRGASPLLATAYVSPVTVSGGIAAITTGWLLGKYRPAVAMVIALSAFTIGMILFMTAPVDQTYWTQTFIGGIIIPWGMDMSFPAATIILSDAVPKKHQGIAASLVNTVVNYSISLGIGFAGTVEVQVNNGGLTPEDILKGYRGAYYVGAGLAALGTVVSIVFWIKQTREHAKPEYEE